MISPDITIDELLRYDLMPPRILKVCRLLEIETLNELINVEDIRVLSIASCGLKTLQDVRDYKLKIGAQLEEVMQFEQEGMCNLEESRRKIAYLSPHEKSAMLECIEQRFKKLNTRARNAFHQFRDFDTLHTAIFGNTPLQLINYSNCGKKTVAEVQEFLDYCKVLIESCTQNIDLTAEKPVFSEEEIFAEKLKKLYPFLDASECVAIAEFTFRTGHKPSLFILYRYISQSKDPSIAVARKFYGLNEDRKRYTLSELAAEFNITTERVRQLTSHAMAIPKDIQQEVKTICDSIGDIIAFNHPQWLTIQEDNMLGSINVEIIPWLIAAVSDKFDIAHIHDDARYYLAKKDLVKNVRLRIACTAMCKAVKLRRIENSRLDILEYITRDKRDYHPEVHKLCPMYADYLCTLEEVRPIDEAHILLLPNAVDVSKAAQQILARNQKAMSLTEIYNEFNSTYPSQALESPSRLRPYIALNHDIVAKGKRSLYALAEWKDEFTGTITEYIEEMLGNSPTPMHFNEVYDKVLEEFPATTISSVITLLTSIYASRFVWYEGNLVGLPCHASCNLPLLTRRSIKRKSFESRLQELKNFVGHEGRMPINTSTNEVETSLCRWVLNIRNGKIETSSEQMQTFEDFLEQCQHLPQNSFELRFKAHCDAIKEIVATTSALPTTRKHLTQYLWMQKYVPMKLDGNRKRYMDDLRSALSDAGIEI